MNANRPAPKARNVIAQAKRGTSAGLGLRPHTNHEPCKGGILRVAYGLIPPLQGSSHFPDVTQGCARSSLPLGFYITGPSALIRGSVWERSCARSRSVMPRIRRLIGPAPKAHNVIAQAKRGTSACLGFRPHTNHEPCKGGIFRVPRGLISPLQGSSHFFDVSQGCARSSLPLGFYITGPSALTLCG